MFCTYESNDPTGGQELCICWRILIEIAWQARGEEDDAFRMGVSVTERATLKYTQLASCDCWKSGTTQGVIVVHMKALWFVFAKAPTADVHSITVSAWNLPASSFASFDEGVGDLVIDWLILKCGLRVATISLRVALRRLWMACRGHLWLLNEIIHHS